MYDTVITMCGNVLTAPEWRRTTNTGTYVMTFRFASTSRRLDRATNQWIDGDSLRVKVACWRTLGQNAFDSIQLGDPLIIHGRIYSRDWVDGNGNKRTSYELDAISMGHDIARGVSHFARRKPAGATDAIDDAASRAAIAGEQSESVEVERPADMDVVHGRIREFDTDRFDIAAQDRFRASTGTVVRGGEGSDDGDESEGDIEDLDDSELDDDEIAAELAVAA